MNVLEQDEASVHPEPPALLSQDSFLETGQKVELVGALWQVFRLILLAWALLCFFCCLHLCLTGHPGDLASLVSNFSIGLLAWVLACKIEHPMDDFPAVEAGTGNGEADEEDDR